jgi:hypothetical protein
MQHTLLRESLFYIHLADRLNTLKWRDTDRYRTIHVRIAAQLGPTSEAYNSLRTCVSVFAKNQDTNWVCQCGNN